MAKKKPKKSTNKTSRPAKETAKANKTPTPRPEMDIDQKIRINELREEIREVTGKDFLEGSSDDCPPEIREQFLKQVLEYEKAETTTYSAILKKDGFDFPPSKQLSDQQIAEKLKVLIRLLARKNVTISHTNHLSDRELYDFLHDHGLCESVADMSANPYYSYHLDVLGSYGEEEMNLYNKFYATKKERRKHAKEFPNWPLPPHVDPPYDRDKDLPVQKILNPDDPEALKEWLKEREKDEDGETKGES